MAKIKICGLRTLADVKIVNKLKPDYVGFILSKGFRRSVSMFDVPELTQHLQKGIKKVGVFVDEPIYVIELAIERGIDIVQLHGNETPEYCSKIQKPVIKMLKPNDFNRAKEYEPYVDYFLFDSGTGTGKTFDWNLLPQTNKPFFLAGGLNKDNLNEAINNINPFAVDMSSSVETDGKKDYDKVKEVIDIIRSNK